MPRSAPPALRAAISNTQSVKDSIIRKYISVSVCSLCQHTQTHVSVPVGFQGPSVFTIPFFIRFAMNYTTDKLFNISGLTFPTQPKIFPDLIS